MTNNITSGPTGPSPADSSHPLAERVRARVAEAGLALDRRDRASRPRAGRRRPTLAAASASTGPATPQMGREARSLRRVFKELGETSRRHRRQTGEPVSAALRQAALGFKQAPSLGSLVAVAAFLDEDGLLAW